MSIVLKENEWAEQMINDKDLGKKPSETMKRVARYYLDKGYSEREVRRKLDAFLIACDPLASLPKWSNSLDYALSRAVKFEAINIDKITISKTEMDIVDSLDKVQTKRLAFVLLCLAKYWVAVNPELDGWVVNKDSEIMKLANVSTSAKRQSLMYFTLKELGLIQFSKKVDNTNVRVNFMDDGEPILEITDFRNLGYQYLMYHGGPYFVCENCGVVTKLSNVENRGCQKYCKECAPKVKLRQRVEYTMRMRYKNVQDPNEDESVYTVYMHRAPNDKRYVGVTTCSLYKRWANGKGYVENSSFNGDIARYGWDNIEHYRIAVVQNRELAYDIEAYYINKFKSNTKSKGYNRSCGKYTRKLDVSLEDYCELVMVDSKGNDLGR